MTATAPQQFRKLAYDILQVGEEFISNDHLVTPEDVEAYAFAVEDFNSWFLGESPFGGSVAHPTLLGNLALHLRHSKYIVRAGLHAKMRFEFLEPVRVGTRVRARGKVVDKYIKRDKHYMVTDYAIEDQDGTPLIRGQFTQMLLEP